MYTFLPLTEKFVTSTFVTKSKAVNKRRTISRPTLPGASQMAIVPLTRNQTDKTSVSVRVRYSVSLSTIAIGRRPDSMVLNCCE